MGYGVFYSILYIIWMIVTEFVIFFLLLSFLLTANVHHIAGILARHALTSKCPSIRLGCLCLVLGQTMARARSSSTSVFAYSERIRVQCNEYQVDEQWDYRRVLYFINARRTEFVVYFFFFHLFLVLLLPSYCPSFRSTIILPNYVWACKILNGQIQPDRKHK